MQWRGRTPRSRTEQAEHQNLIEYTENVLRISEKSPINDYKCDIRTSYRLLATGRRRARDHKAIRDRWPGPLRVQSRHTLRLGGLIKAWRSCGVVKDLGVASLDVF